MGINYSKTSLWQHGTSLLRISIGCILFLCFFCPLLAFCAAAKYIFLEHDVVISQWATNNLFYLLETPRPKLFGILFAFSLIHTLCNMAFIECRFNTPNDMLPLSIFRTIRCSWIVSFLYQRSRILGSNLLKPI